MLGTNKVVVGLDVGSYAVKAVALQANKDRITLQGYAQARIEGQDPAEAIRKVVDQLGVKARRVVTSVSGRSVIVRQVETPKLEGEELKKHIAYEAEKYIPFGSEEVIIDAQSLPPRAGAQAQGQAAQLQQVMLVAVRKSFVLDHISQLKVAGVAPEVVDVDVFALANCYELLGPPAPAETEKKATALIDIGAAKSNIAIVLGTRVLFTREIYLAGNEITEAIARTFNEPADQVDHIKTAPGEALDALVDAAMPAFEDLANEIRLSFDYVEGQFDAEVSTVVLSGGSAQLPNAAGILGNILGRPVHVFDPLAGLDLVPSKYDIHGLDANSPGLTVALGLAVRQLGFPRAGLGGSQSHAWQPRQHRGADGAVPAGAGSPTLPTAPDQPQAAMAPMPRALTPPLGNPTVNTTPAPAVPPPPPPLMVAPPPAPRTPPPAAFAPPPSLTPPPAPAAMPLDPPPAPETGTARRGQTELFLNETNRSGLLVVLDDDDEDDVPLASERIEKGSLGASGGSGSKRPTVQVEGFDDEEPPLPDLPKKI